MDPTLDYVGVKPLDVLARELGYEIKDLVKLDANENPYGPIDEIKEALRNMDFLHIYPDPLQNNVRDALTAFLNKYIGSSAKLLTKENIVCGTGSDELLEVILKLIQPKYVVNCTPTFGMYDFLGRLAKAEVITVPRTENIFFEVDIDKILVILKENDSERKVVYLASPNNPTGGRLSLENIEKLCNSKKTFIVIDQAYAEFDFEEANKVFKLLEKYDNLLILRTFSKWAGLAGLRVGYSISNSKIIEKMIAIKQPYNVTVPSEVGVLAALKYHEKIFKTQILKIKEEKIRLLLLLQEFEQLKSCPSKSNFILFHVDSTLSAVKIYLELRKLGILIRYYSKGILKNYIRISIGRSEDTDKLIKGLRFLFNSQFHKISKLNENETISEKKIDKISEIRSISLKFDGIIFDMDGVLAEVSSSYRQAIEQTCTFFKVTVSQEQITEAKIKGNSNNDWILTYNLIKTYSKNKTLTQTLSQDVVTEKFQDLYLNKLRDLETLIPSRTFLLELRRRCKLGFSIVTGRPRSECIYFLNEFNLLPLFMNNEADLSLVCMNETKNPKPSGEPVLKALKFMNASKKDNIVMIGDTTDDILAAVEAGIYAIGVILPGNDIKTDKMGHKMKEVGAFDVFRAGFIELLDYLPASSDFNTSYCSASAQIKSNHFQNDSNLSGNQWNEAHDGARVAEISRKTKETSTSCKVNLDGTGKHDISTGIGFLDHMLSAFSKHSLIDITLSCKGDLWIDDHHTSEDVGITLGECLDQSLGPRKSIKRWGVGICPLDESLSRAIVDISSRPHCFVDLKLKREKVGELSTEMISHVLTSLVTSARITSHVEVIRGNNDHHKAESAFKAFAVAFRKAIERDPRVLNSVPSTKGVLM